MVRHPAVDMISFTGSTAGGQDAVATAAETLKRVSMELGGKNPQLVFADADLEAAVDAVVFGVYFNAGECCNSGSRLLVQREIAEASWRRWWRARARSRSATLWMRRRRSGRSSAPSISARSSATSPSAAAAGAIRLGGERLASRARPVHGPDRGRRRHAGDGDRPRGGLRAGAVGADLRHGGRGHQPRQRHRLRPVRRHLEPHYDTCQTAAAGIRAGTVWLNRSWKALPSCRSAASARAGSAASWVGTRRWTIRR